jgi:WD40 repeat protein
VLGEAAFHHERKITAVAVLSGQRVLSTADDRTARLWDIQSGRQIAKFCAQNSSLHDLLVLPGEEQFLTLGDSEADLWDLKSCQILHRFTVKNPVSAFAYDPASKRLAVGYCGGLTVWDLPSKEKLADNPKSLSTSVVFNSRGDVVAVAIDRAICLYPSDLSQSPSFLKQKEEYAKDGSLLSGDSGHISMLAPSPGHDKALVLGNGSGKRAETLDDAPEKPGVETGRLVARRQDYRRPAGSLSQQPVPAGCK